MSARKQKKNNRFVTKPVTIGFKHEDCINGQAVGSISFNELKGQKWVTKEQAQDLARILKAEFVEY